jgi:hypothetical protein
MICGDVAENRRSKHAHKNAPQKVLSNNRSELSRYLVPETALWFETDPQGRQLKRDLENHLRRYLS